MHHDYHTCDHCDVRIPRGGVHHLLLTAPNKGHAAGIRIHRDICATCAEIITARAWTEPVVTNQ